MEKLNDSGEEFKNSQEYRNYIQQIRGQKTLTDKLMFVVKEYDEVEGKKVFDDFAKYYNKEITDEIINELRSTITTPKELDQFFSTLISRLHEFYDSKGIKPEEYHNYAGHAFIKAILRVILPAFVNLNEHVDDLDWWYTIGRHMSFSSNIMNYVIKVYLKHIDDSKSIEFKEYLESKGWWYFDDLVNFYKKHS